MNTRVWTAALVMAGLAGLAGCQTVPHAERVAAYETAMKTRFVGKSSDELVLTLGPPDSSFKLSDGREVFQYENRSEFIGGGETYTDWVTRTSYRTVRSSDGSRVRVPAHVSIPVVRTTPIYSRTNVCINRFVVDVNSTVEDFRWEGNACF
ncbi:MAG: hypothetical protein MUF14_06250 [Hyphomonadaceae bacterium]|nr:hypothetical protein [Hyphomonadaceae bacterium]